MSRLVMGVGKGTKQLASFLDCVKVRMPEHKRREVLK
jgi:hypothetical protein